MTSWTVEMTRQYTRLQTFIRVIRVIRVIRAILKVNQYIYICVYMNTMVRIVLVDWNVIYQGLSGLSGLSGL